MAQEKNEKQKNKSEKHLRPPIVCFLGHVDHGKTSLLDHIRESNLQGDETGGITQSTAAYHTQGITFIDTPGHEAFTAMRARGGQTADIAILVVAADDGVMPQTIEAINHIRAAEVPFIVAINKIDLQEAKPEKVKQQLAEEEIMVEDWGGETVAVECSAITGEGVDELLEMIHLVAEMEELVADPEAQAEGVVIESSMDKKKGPLATVVMQNGTLESRDHVLAKKTYGRIKQIWNDHEEPIEKISPGMPGEILGLEETVPAGSKIITVSGEKEAQKKIAAQKSGPPQRRGFKERKDGKVLSLIIKANTDGRLDAVRDSILQLQTEEVSIDIIHQGLGNISQADALLAQSGNAVILGFKVDIETVAQQVIKQNQLIARTYNIIYKLIEDTEKLITGKEKEGKLVRSGIAKVLQVFTLSNGTTVAGCEVKEGLMKKGDLVRIIRDKEEVTRGKITSLRSYKEDVSSVSEGEECGIVIKPQTAIEEGDFIEGLEKAEIETFF